MGEGGAGGGSSSGGGEVDALQARLDNLRKDWSWGEGWFVSKCDF